MVNALYLQHIRVRDMNKVKFIDLFAGIGGIRKGFEIAFGAVSITDMMIS